MAHLEIFNGNIAKIGELGAKGENEYITFTVAETARIRKDDEWVDGETTWTNCVAFGRMARTIAHSAIVPGTRVLIMGTRQTRSYEKDNEKRYSDSIIVESFGVSVDFGQTVTEISVLSKDNSLIKAGDKAKGEKKETPKAKAPAKKSTVKEKENTQVEAFQDDDEFDFGDFDL